MPHNRGLLPWLVSYEYWKHIKVVKDGAELKFLAACQNALPNGCQHIPLDCPPVRRMCFCIVSLVADRSQASAACEKDQQ